MKCRVDASIHEADVSKVAWIVGKSKLLQSVVSLDLFVFCKCECKELSVTSKKRRKTKLWERLTPCNCCGYPISQRHHLLTIAEYGRESNYTRLLCANCHELYHICEKAIADILRAGPDEQAKTRSTFSMNVLINHHPEGQARVYYMFDLIKLVNQARYEMEREREIGLFVMKTFFSMADEAEQQCNQ